MWSTHRRLIVRRPFKRYAPRISSTFASSNRESLIFCDKSYLLLFMAKLRYLCVPNITIDLILELPIIL